VYSPSTAPFKLTCIQVVFLTVALDTAKTFFLAETVAVMPEGRTMAEVKARVEAIVMKVCGAGTELKMRRGD
jgi:hypothetical protein